MPMIHLFKRYRSHCVSFLLIAMTLGVYLQVRHHEFINFDDNVYITDNPYIKYGLTSEGVKWAFTSVYASNWHPLVWLSLLTNYQFFGQVPDTYFLFNLLFHIANSLLVFYLFKNITQSLWKGAIIAFLFALHPVHVESVAWATERKDVLSTFFFLLTLRQYIAHARQPKPFRYLLIVVFMALSLMCKPMLVTLPFILLLMDYWPLQRILRLDTGSSSSSASGDWFSFTRLVLEKTPLYILSTLSCFITFYVQQRGGAVKSVTAFSFSDRISNALLSYVKYIFKIVWPFDLSIFYPFPGSIQPLDVLLAAAVIVAISAWAAIKIKRLPWLAMGWFWFLGTLVPVIGIVQVGNHAMADRYAYVPCIGIYLIIAELLYTAYTKIRLTPRFITAFSACLLLMIATLTWTQLSYWQNDEKLFKHALAVTDGNYLAHNNLALDLADKGKYQEALYHLRTALKIKPEFILAHNNLGVLLTELGKNEQARFHFEQALAYSPNFYEARLNIASQYLDLGKPEKTLALCRLVIEKTSAYPEAHILMGDALSSQKKYLEAIIHYRSAIAAHPFSPQAHNHLGSALVRTKQFEKAEAQFNTAVQLSPENLTYRRNLMTLRDYLDKLHRQITELTEITKRNPKNVSARIKLGELMHQAGMENQAVQQYSAVLKFNPANLDALSKLAELFIEKKELRKAKSVYEKIIDLRPGENRHYYNLACIYSRLKDAQNAIIWLQKAIDFGYNNWEHIESDTDLQFIRQNPEFNKLLEKAMKSRDTQRRGKDV